MFTLRWAVSEMFRSLIFIKYGRTGDCSNAAIGSGLHLLTNDDDGDDAFVHDAFASGALEIRPMHHLDVSNSSCPLSTTSIMSIDTVQEEFEQIDNDHYGFITRRALENYAMMTNQDDDFVDVSRTRFLLASNPHYFPSIVNRFT